MEKLGPENAWKIKLTKPEMMTATATEMANS